MPSRLESVAHGTKQILLVDALVDDVAQPLSPRLGGEGKPRLTHLLYLFKVIFKEGIYAQGRKRNADLVVLISLKYLGHELVDMRVITA